MKRLEVQDQHHLVATQGWLELGNPLEANEELEQITAECGADSTGATTSVHSGTHPELLRTLCSLCIATHSS